MHNVITNAWRGDPYPIDTLLLFMANMAWNSTMNTSEIRKMLNDKHARMGEYKIPFLVVCDAFQSETTAFADLVLPDTTYLERHDVMSILDRPISDFDGPTDSVRVPVVPPKGECKPFQEVLIELASRLKFPAFVQRGRHAQVPRLSGLHHQLRDRSGLGHRISFRLARQGRRQVHARRAQSAPVGDVRAEQLRLSPQAAALVPVHAQLEPRLHGVGAARAHPPLHRSRRHPDLFGSAAEIPPRGARQGRGAQAARASCRRASTTSSIRCRSTTSRSKRSRRTSSAFPLRAVTQRPMAMYHSWDSQNAWLRQIHAHNHLFVNPAVARAAGIADGGWMWVESPWGKVRCLASYSEAVEPGTVWTWNAIGKARGRVESRARRERIAARVSAEPPDRRRAAGRRRRTHFEFGSDHRPGGLVRRPRAHLQGGSRRSRRRRRRNSRRCRRRREPARPRPRWQAFFAGRGQSGGTP